MVRTMPRRMTSWILAPRLVGGTARGWSKVGRSGSTPPGAVPSTVRTPRMLGWNLQ